MKDTVKIKIKLSKDDLDREDKKDIIVEALKQLIDKLEETNGNMQSSKMTDGYCWLEYVHVSVEEAKS